MVPTRPPPGYLQTHLYLLTPAEFLPCMTTEAGWLEKYPKLARGCVDIDGLWDSGGEATPAPQQ